MFFKRLIYHIIQRLSEIYIFLTMSTKDYYLTSRYNQLKKNISSHKFLILKRKPPYKLS